MCGSRVCVCVCVGVGVGVCVYVWVWVCVPLCVCLCVHVCVCVWVGRWVGVGAGSRGRWRVDLVRGTNSVGVGPFSFYDTSGRYVPTQSGFNTCRVVVTCFRNPV